MISPLERGHPAVLQFRRLRVVAGSLRLLDLEPHVLELFLLLLRRLDAFFFLLPLGLEAAALFLEVGQLALQLLQALLRRLVALLAQRFALDLELHDAALHFVQLRRHRVDLHPQPRGRLVDEVDRLVGKEPIGDVAVRQQGRGDERRVLELDAVMDLVAIAQAAQDADGVFDRRLADQHGLESPLEGGVLLDVLAILVERRRADRVQLAARQHRLQHVRGIDRAFGRAGADHRVQLVDEQDHLALGVDDLLEDGLQPLLELAAILRAGHQRAHVERDDLLVLEAFGHVAADDALCQAFDDGRLADAGLADEDGVVLRAAGEHLDHAPDLVVSADDRVELALLRERGQVAPVALERLVFALGVLIGDSLAAADRRERLEDSVARQPGLLEQARGGGAAFFAGDGDEQVLRADVLILQPLGLRARQIGDQLQPGRDRRRRAAVHLGLLADRVPGVSCDRGRIQLQLAQQCRDHAVLLLDERDEQVLGLDLRVVLALGEILCGQDRFLGLLGVFVQVHDVFTTELKLGPTSVFVDQS